MKALITGGAGFIGSHLAEELLRRGQEVVVLDNLSTGCASNLDHLQGSPGFRLQQGTVLDNAILSPLVREADVVYHLAASVGVKYVLDHPVVTLETNVGGTENVLRLAATHGGKKVVIASTSEVYGKATKFPFSEDDDSILGSTSIGRWGYACSKALDEFFALAYHRERGLPVVILRFFNTVGPRQVGRYGMVMPRFVSQAVAGDPITVYGDGEQRRSFTYVKDVVRAIGDIALTPSAEGQVFNVGTDNDVSINELAELVRRTLNSDSEIIHVPYSEVYGSDFEDTKFRLPDISKLQACVDYDPITDLAFIVKEIADTPISVATPKAAD